MRIKNRINLSAICLLLILLCIIFVGCDPRYGFMDSRFQLADDSRLPKWFTVPKGYSRKDLKVTIDLYTSLCPFFSNNAVTILYGPPPANKEIMIMRLRATQL